MDLAPPTGVTIAPLVRPAGGDVRRAIERVAATRFRGVQISAALKGMRPRELDRRARKDVLATLSRGGLMLTGVDLMIPHRDWLEPAAQDRAASAALAAVELAADLGRVPLSMTLPVEHLGGDIASALIAAADGHGVALAVHAEHDLRALADWLNDNEAKAVGAALDPAALLASGDEPADAATRLAEHLRVARLDDHVAASVASAGGRCPLGQGDLDLLAYRAALSTCRSLRAMVVELRDLPDPVEGLEQAERAVLDF